jgi:hypothetical protein
MASTVHGADVAVPQVDFNYCWIAAHASLRAHRRNRERYVEEQPAYGCGAVLALHGLIHLMAGRWDLDMSGIRFFGLLWLLAAVGRVIASAGLLTHTAWVW